MLVVGSAAAVSLFYVKCTNVHTVGIGWVDFKLSSVVKVKS